MNINVKTLLAVVMAGAVTLGACAAKPQTPKLKIWQKDVKKCDTVYNPVYRLVAVTEPGAQAWINNETAHVYKTGSFGAELTLKPGLNNVSVKAKAGRKTVETNLKVYYDATSRPKSTVKTLPKQTKDLAEPLNIVTDNFAYLQYGNGGDRLGGSKMNFIDSGIPLTAIGEIEDLYKVMLGSSQYAYIPKNTVNPGGDGMQLVNTLNASISNTGKTDRIVMSLPYRLPYWSRTEIDPQTIKVTLYGAANNTNWLKQTNDPGIIKFVDLQQTASDALTVVIRLNDNYNWGYSAGYEGTSNNFVIEVRHRPASLELKDLTIGLDAGHGGRYPGAISPSGLTEKEVNLDIVLNAARILRDKGAKVVLTRDGDTGPSMTERKRIWKEANVDLAISVHNNASGNPLIPLGTSAYYKHIFDRALADSMHRSMLSLGLTNFGLTGNFNFSLNGPTDYPNALVEVLFMSSLPEEEMLADPGFRKKLGEKIVEGIENYLKEAATR